MKAEGFFLTYVSGESENKREKELSNELYDNFTHNELTGNEVIEKIIEFTEVDVNESEDYPEEIMNAIYKNDKYVLDYDRFTGSLSVFKHYFNELNN